MTHNLLCKSMGNTPIPQVMHYISRPDNFHKKVLIEEAVASNLLLYLACNGNMVQPMIMEQLIILLFIHLDDLPPVIWSHLPH